MFVKKLNELMAEKKVTRAQLTADLGIGRNQIKYWETHGNLPSADVLRRIADYFGVPLYVFWSFDESDQQNLFESTKSKLSEVVTHTIQSDAEAALALDYFSSYLSDITEYLKVVYLAAMSLRFKIVTSELKGIPNDATDRKYIFDPVAFREHVIDALKKANSIEVLQDRPAADRADKKIKEIETAQYCLIIKVLEVQNEMKKAAENYARQAIKDSKRSDEYNENEHINTGSDEE